MTAKIINLHPKRREPKEPPDMSELIGLARVLPVITQWSDLDPATIKAESTWADLDIDSLERVEICIEIEDLLKIELDADEFEFLGTVGEFAALVDKKMMEKANG